jgi:hypothetical protein
MSTTPAAEEICCDLCILGAGIAGLNALFAATRHLWPQAKVVLVDRNARPGGMWGSTYSYVRLHQPHPMFTVGNIPWAGRRDPSHLATRSEVLDHLQHCFDVCRTRVSLDARFGYTYRGHEDSADEVVVDCAAMSADGAPLRIRTKRLVKAFGYDVQTNDPLPLSSKSVRSVSPNHFDLLGEEMQSSTAPIYVIGAGKTGMDTAHLLLTRYPDRPVSLVIGTGMLFLNRDQQFPPGLQRWYAGKTPLDVFLDVAKRFDGRNEAEVLAHLREHYTLSLVPDARHFLYGLISKAELDTIARGARAIIKDYLVDVEDRDGTPTLLLRSGETRAMEPGSFVINCTGYVKETDQPYEPYLSASDRVLTIRPGSAVHLLSTVSAYLLVHLWLTEKLRGLPLYEVDPFALQRKSRDVSSVLGGSHMLYNMLLMLDRLPKGALEEFGTDTTRWYPLPRRFLSSLKLLHFQRGHRDHFRRALDAVRERFDIRCGPLPQASVERAL